VKMVASHWSQEIGFSSRGWLMAKSRRKTLSSNLQEGLLSLWSALHAEWKMQQF
jgi:hypothetical protein